MNNYLTDFFWFLNFFDISSYYNVYLKNIILYFMPVETKLIFDNISFYFKELNLFSGSNDYSYLFKINKIEYNKFRFYNYGYCYKTSDYLYNILDNLDIAFPPDTINSIIVEMSDDNQIIIKDDNIFITNILSYSTNKSKFHILLYYYLQKYLGNFDIINKVKIEIDNIFYDINHLDTLINIYNQLEINIESN